MTEKNLNVKRYVKAQHDLLSYIVEHRLTAGDKLPIESELARMFSVSLITMRRAIGGLVETGIVERFQGKGTFLRKNITEKDSCLGTMLFAILDQNLPPSFLFVEDFLRACWKRGWKLRYVYAYDSDMSGFINAAREADGIFIYGRCGEYADPVVNSLKVPKIVIGETRNPLNATYVSIDFAAEITTIMKALAAQGARRIAFLNAPYDYIPAQIYGRTFLQQCRELGLASGENDLYWDRTGHRKADIVEFFRKNPLRQYDAVLCEGGLYGFFTTHLLLSGQTEKLPMIGVLSADPMTEKYDYEGVFYAVSREEDLIEKCVDVMIRKMNGRDVPSTVLLRNEIFTPNGRPVTC